MKAGFIGLGNMGRPMARNLIRAGHELTVYNRTPGRANELAGEGAAVASSVAESCRPGVVMTMLADDSAADETTFGKEGIRPGAGALLSIGPVGLQHLLGH